MLAEALAMPSFPVAGTNAVVNALDERAIAQMT